MRHDIVPHFLFARGGDFVVDVQGKVTQRLELCFGDRKPQFLFGFREGNPELAPSAELGLFRKDMLHFPAGIAPAQGILINAVIHEMRPLLPRLGGARLRGSEKSVSQSLLYMISAICTCVIGENHSLLPRRFLHIGANTSADGQAAWGEKCTIRQKKLQKGVDKRRTHAIITHMKQQRRCGQGELPP